MIDRSIRFPSGSFFLFGPRGSGKSYWLKNTYAGVSAYIDLLEARVFNRLSADPQRLIEYIPNGHSGPVIVDEIQKIPALLDEVHRLLETSRGLQFILTGSSPRKLRRTSSNLLGGRAATCHFHPLTAMELADGFDLMDHARSDALIDRSQGKGDVFEDFDE